MKSGWNANFHDRQLYTGLGADPNEPNLFQFPGFLPETAQWLLDNRNIVGLGVDSASADVGTSTTYMVHTILLANDMYFLENMQLDEVPEGSDTVFVALPMKVKDAGETPVRIMAIVGMEFNDEPVAQTNFWDTLWGQN